MKWLCWCWKETRPIGFLWGHVIHCCEAHLVSHHSYISGILRGMVLYVEKGFSKVGTESDSLIATRLVPLQCVSSHPQVENVENIWRFMEQKGDTSISHVNLANIGIVNWARPYEPHDLKKKQLGLMMTQRGMTISICIVVLIFMQQNKQWP